VLDIFIDLTAHQPLGRRVVGGTPWPNPDLFTPHVRQVTCVVAPDAWPAHLKRSLPASWNLVESTSAIEACSAAMSRAGATGASLLVLHGPVEPSPEALMGMRTALARDPMYGCVAARIRCSNGCCVRRPSRSGLEPGAWIPRRTLADVAALEVVPELFESSLLFPSRTAAEFGRLDARFSSLPGAILHYLSRARRCGYRTVLANRAVMAVNGLSCDEAPASRSAVPPTDQILLRRLTPELDRAWDEFRGGSNERFEQLSGHVHRANAGRERPAVLLDIRNVAMVHNGTSQAVLGCVDALHRMALPWDVTVLAQSSAIRFHGLTKAWPEWALSTTFPSQPAAAALRLSQPWHIQEMIDLHRVALFNVYFLLDTISWDVVYPPPRRIDGTWSFLADHADGLLFDSAFTEQRFVERFESARKTRRAICRYPFDPATYAEMAGKRRQTADYILVVGNELDHKDAVRTIELLADAFPFRNLASLGPRLTATPHLRVYRSGSLSDEEVSRLYAEAALVVFPSFYEGFGFPMVTALAHGKTLVARESELLDEIAARCSTGRLVTFTRRDQLVEIVGRLLHHKPVPEAPLGSVKSEVLRRWSDVARDIKAFMEGVMGQPSSRWLTREHAINQLLAFHT
jgi:glycosyltransferase involved in cell wall biosynthesis